MKKTILVISSIILIAGCSSGANKVNFNIYDLIKNVALLDQKQQNLIRSHNMLVKEIDKSIKGLKDEVLLELNSKIDPVSEEKIEPVLEEKNEEEEKEVEENETQV